MSAPLTLFDSYSRSLLPFRDPDPADPVRLYSCGPTVYNFAHLGNLRAYVFTDTLRRVLEWRGHGVNHVINITDVGHLVSDADAGEDKMERAAHEAGKTIWQIAHFYTDAFKADLAALAIREPSRWSVASEHIAEMIAFAKRIAPAHCYELDGGLYFDVSTVPDYGRLAGGRDDAAAGRIDPVSGKRQPQDFAIWRRSPAGERRQMEWDSPWGRGAPGWHLECSVMSLKYLGPAPFDIHTGGIDHREIHHPNEIAQNQADCGCVDPGFTGARVWMHNNFLVARDRDGGAAKMSKSDGGFLTLAGIVARGVHPLAYRLLCLQAHYRSEMEFSRDGLAAALTRLKRLAQAVERLGAAADETARGGEDHLARLDAAMADDLNTPRALPVMDEMLADRRLSPGRRLALLGEFDAVLGLGLARLSRADLRVRPASATLTEEAIAARLAERTEAKQARDFAAADAIRDALIAQGVELMDGDALGWDWRIDP